MYSPPSQWIWHPPPHKKGSFQPYKDFAANTWVEVMREEDPFGDEHYGAWYVSAKGSGVWYFIGKTITFKEHADAFAHFGERDNEAMCRAAAAAGSEPQFEPQAPSLATAEFKSAQRALLQV